jgi:hypothetical protein
MPFSVRIAEGRMAVGYAVPDAAPWLMTVVDQDGILASGSKPSIGLG